MIHSTQSWKALEFKMGLPRNVEESNRIESAHQNSCPHNEPASHHLSIAAAHDVKQPANQRAGGVQAAGDAGGYRLVRLNTSPANADIPHHAIVYTYRCDQLGHDPHAEH